MLNLDRKTQPNTLNDYLRFASFILKNKSDKCRGLRIAKLYADSACGAPLYFDEWKKIRSQKKLSAEIKNFRESKEFILFKKQLEIIIFKIKTIFLKRQKTEAPTTDELELKSLDELLARLLNPNIVTDEKKSGVSESELSYSDGKRYLEGLLDSVERAPFPIVHTVIQSLLEKQKDQKIDSLTVCASGTRQNLYHALSEFSSTDVSELDDASDITSEFDDALLTVLRQEAYSFMNRFTLEIYQGNEIHLNASLVNHVYNKFGLLEEGVKKISDTLAYPPRQDDNIYFLTNNKKYRVAWTEVEANKFFYLINLNSFNIIFSIIERLTIRYQRDISSIATFDSARFFLEKLIKISGAKKDKYDINKFRKQFFGYYQIKKLKLQEKFTLNEAQMQEIDDYGVTIILSQLAESHTKGSEKYIFELKELCFLLASYPEIKRTAVSTTILKIYDALIKTIISKTIIKKLDPSGKTTDKIIIKYIHDQLNYELKKYNKEDERSEKRKKIASAVLQRLGKEIKSEETIYFGEAKIQADIALDTIDDSRYCSLDQLCLDDEGTPVKSPGEIYQLLFNNILNLMLDGDHIRLPYVQLKNINLLYNNQLEYAWVTYKIDGAEVRVAFTEYFRKLSKKEQIDFIDELYEKTLDPIITNIMINCFKMINLDNKELYEIYLKLEKLLFMPSEVYHQLDDVICTTVFVKNSNAYVDAKIHFEGLWYDMGSYFDNEEKFSTYLKPDKPFGLEYSFKKLNCLQLFLYHIRDFEFQKIRSNADTDPICEKNMQDIFSVLIHQFSPLECWKIFFYHAKRLSKYHTDMLFLFSKIIIDQCPLEDNEPNNTLLFDFLILFIVQQSADSLNYLLQRYRMRLDINKDFKVNNKPLKALQIAIIEGDNSGECINVLIKHGAKIETAPDPLSLAMDHDHFNAFRALLENKADPNRYRENLSQKTLLHHVIPYHFKYYKMLLAYGAAYDIPDAKGTTVLKLAADLFLDKKEQYLLEIFTYDNGVIFNQFKKICLGRPSYKFWATTLKDYLLRDEIRDMKGVVRYLITKNESSGELLILAKELSEQKLSVSLQQQIM